MRPAGPGPWRQGRKRPRARAPQARCAVTKAIPPYRSYDSGQGAECPVRRPPSPLRSAACAAGGPGLFLFLLARAGQDRRQGVVALVAGGLLEGSPFGGGGVV